MIHGDLKGVRLGHDITILGIGLQLLDIKANILIDCNRHARIADFGLLTLIPDKTSLISTFSRLDGGTIRWMSPELLDPESFDLPNDSCPTEKSDCYALGMVIYEVFSGQVPFTQDNNVTVIRKVIDGKRPERPPAQFTSGLWEILERCWKHRPCDRPSLKDLLQRLEDVARAPQLPSTDPSKPSLPQLNC